MKDQPAANRVSPTLSSLFTVLTGGILLLFANFVMILIVNPEPEIGWADNLGTILWMLGFLLWLFPAITMRKSVKRRQKGQTYMETDILVKSGIFKVIRHPQYLGFIFFNTGFIGITQRPLPIILALISILFIVYGIRYEDKELEKRFGEKYLEYKKKTPAFNLFLGITRLWKKETLSS